MLKFVDGSGGENHFCQEDAGQEVTTLYFFNFVLRGTSSTSCFVALLQLRASWHFFNFALYFCDIALYFHDTAFYFFRVSGHVLHGYVRFVDAYRTSVQCDVGDWSVRPRTVYDLSGDLPLPFETPPVSGS